MGNTTMFNARCEQQDNNVVRRNNETMDDDPSNGLCLFNCYLPEEVLIAILSHVDANELLKCALVCKKWNAIVKSSTLWMQIYKRKHLSRRRVKLLPWYVYYIYFAKQFFDRNLIRNGNGQDNYKYWTILKNLGDGFAVEAPPAGAPPLPLDVEDFNGQTSCFATSFYDCRKSQTFHMDKCLAYRKIFNQFKPKIYASEWICGRFDAGCLYRLLVRINYVDTQREYPIMEQITQWSDPQWRKIELVIDDYGDDIKSIEFVHEGKDTMFWKGWYGSKMAGPVLKILFDTIEEDN